MLFHIPFVVFKWALSSHTTRQIPNTAGIAAASRSSLKVGLGFSTRTHFDACECCVVLVELLRTRNLGSSRVRGFGLGHDGGLDVPSWASKVIGPSARSRHAGAPHCSTCIVVPAPSLHLL